jgi:hypothetical protein
VQVGIQPGRAGRHQAPPGRRGASAGARPVRVRVRATACPVPAPAATRLLRLLSISYRPVTAGGRPLAHWCDSHGAAGPASCRFADPGGRQRNCPNLLRIVSNRAPASGRRRRRGESCAAGVRGRIEGSGRTGVPGGLSKRPAAVSCPTGHRPDRLATGPPPSRPSAPRHPAACTVRAARSALPKRGLAS